ncbi:MAG: hypothetical protein IPM37_09080 [Hahellaceae bacterium]|nr:hypothetical protein [Hahellaceae bacterium]
MTLIRHLKEGWRLTQLGCLGALLAFSPYGVADTVDDESADKRLYQEAKFHFYRSDFMHTLVLLENDHNGTSEIDNQYHNLNHLLAAEAAFKLNMLDSVQHILEHLEFTAREASIQNQVQFLKGKLAYHREQWGQAITLLSAPMPTLSADWRDEARYYRANSELALNQSVDAATALSGISSQSLWGAYGYFNLGARYVNKENSPSKALVAFRVAATLTDQTPEGLELRDHINLEAGKLALKGKDHDKALGFLQNVQATGTAAPTAILYYGLAQSIQGRQRTAIQTWYRAKRYGLVVPGVADAFMAIAYGYEQEKLKATAIDAYLEAIAAYERELRHIGEIEKEIETSGVLALLKKVQTDDTSVEWFLTSELASNTPRVALTYYLMNDPDFFSQARVLLELSNSADDVGRGLQRLDALASVLKKRSVQAGRQPRSTGNLPVNEGSLNQLITQRNAMVEEFKRLPEGVIKQAATLQIKALDGELRMLKSRYQNLSGRTTSANGGFYQEQLRAIDALRVQFRQLQSELQAQVADIDQGLETQAVKLLNTHHDYIDDFFVRSQLALVTLYDEIAVTDLKKSAEIRLDQQGGGQ